MTLLQKAKPEMAYLKLGIYGEAGSGKTFTSASIAIGLHKFIKSKKPVAFADTETGSDFLIRRFEDEKIEFVVAKTRAFKDLLGIIDEAEKECSVLIIDSVTHYWNEIVTAFKQKHGITRLRLKDWDPLKHTWREFTDRYIASTLHIISCSRSADKWAHVEDDEDGAKELQKVGTKPRTETQFAYEPSMLVEMELVQLSPNAGGKLVHRAYVRKDRFDVINARVLDDPTFEDFLPHIELLNLGGKHRAIEPGRDSQEMFTTNNNGEYRAVTRDILVENIEAEIKCLYPSRSEDDSQARKKLMQTIFNTKSWTEISKRRSLDELQAGLESIRALSPEQSPNEKPKKGDKK